MRDYSDMPVEVAECAQRFGFSYNLDPDPLLFEMPALVEATARWLIRNDDDTESLHWLRELIAWHNASNNMIARLAAHMLETEFLPYVEAFVSSPSLLVLDS